MKRKGQTEAWRTFETDIPWLNRSHRTLVAIAAEMQGRIISGDEVSVSGYNLLRFCISQMAATPVDASKASMPEDDKPEDDANKKYF